MESQLSRILDWFSRRRAEPLPLEDGDGLLMCESRLSGFALHVNPKMEEALPDGLSSEVQTPQL